jgi:glycine cleavage system H protein
MLAFKLEGSTEMSSEAKSGTYSEGQFWFKRKGDSLILGISEKAAEELGEAHQAQLPRVGDDFTAGDCVVELKGANGILELITPASGLIQEVNETIQAEPKLLTEDPEEEGWLVKLEIQDASDLKAYLDEEQDEADPEE